MPEISTPAQVMAVRGADINALVARQQYEQNVQQYQQQQLQLQQQQAMQDQRRQQLVNEVNYLSSVRRRVLDVSDEGKVNEYLQGKGYTPDEIKFITSYYERGGRVSGASREQQGQIATYGILRGGGLSKAETKEVVSSGTITYEQAKKLTPETRSALGVDYFYSQQERLRAEQARAKAEEEKPSPQILSSGTTTSEQGKSFYQEVYPEGFWKTTFITGPLELQKEMAESVGGFFGKIMNWLGPGETKVPGVKVPVYKTETAMYEGKTQLKPYFETEARTITGNQEFMEASGKVIGSVIGGSILYFTPARPILAFAQVVEGTSTALNPKADTTTRVFGGVEAIGGGLMLISDVSKLFRPMIIKQYNPETGRMVKTLQPPIQYQQKDVLVKVGPYQAGEGTLTAIRPAATRAVTTPFKQTLLELTKFDMFQPKIVEVSKPAAYIILPAPSGKGIIFTKQMEDITGTPVSATVNEPLLLRGRIGVSGEPGKSFAVFKLKGTQRELSAEEVQNLFKTSLPYEKQLMTGISPADSRFFKEYIETKSLGKVTFNPKEVIYYPATPGKTISRFEGFANVKNIIETPDYDIYTGTRTVRQIKSEFPRPAQVVKIPVISAVYKEDLLGTFRQPSAASTQPFKSRYGARPVSEILKDLGQVQKAEAPAVLPKPIPAQTFASTAIQIPKVSVPALAPTAKISEVLQLGGVLMSAPVAIQKPSAKVIEYPLQKPAQEQINIPLEKTTPTQINIPKYVGAEATQQATSTVQTQTLQQIQLQEPAKLTIITPPSPPASAYAWDITKPKTELLRKLVRGKVLSARGYKTFVIRKGKKVYLPGVALRGEAIRKGEIKATTTLAATFGVEPTNIGIPGIESSYQPSPKVFRGYKIKGTAKIPLKDTWIQKAGTRKEPTIKGGRLSARSEIAELVSLRKAKSRKGGFFR